MEVLQFILILYPYSLMRIMCNCASTCNCFAKKNQTSTLEIINNYVDFVTSVTTGGNELTCTSTVLVFLSGILFVRTKNEALLYYIFFLFCLLHCIYLHSFTSIVLSLMFSRHVPCTGTWNS